MAFKYSEEDSKRLQKAVNNYNKKVNRLMKSNHPYLPDKVSISEIKSGISNRWDFKREVKYLEQFTTRGSERLIVTKGGATLTKYEYQLLEQEQKRLYSKLSYKISKYKETKPRVFGVEQEESYARMGDEIYENLIARRNNISKRKLHDINKTNLRILRNLVARTEEYFEKENTDFKMRFIEQILPGSNTYWDLDEEKINYIREKLKGLTPNQFMDMYEREQALRVIKLKYDTKLKLLYGESKREMEEMINTLYENIDTMVKDYE